MYECEKFMLELTKANSMMGPLDPAVVDTSTSIKISLLRARCMELVEVGKAMLAGSPTKKARKHEEEDDIFS